MTEGSLNTFYESGISPRIPSSTKKPSQNFSGRAMGAADYCFRPALYGSQAEFVGLLMRSSITRT
jgi:hypothetical protein